MAANKKVRFGPIALTNTLTTNILNPPTLTGGVVTGTVNTNTYFLIRHIRIINKTANSATFSLFIGTTGTNTAGTEFEGNGTQVPGNSAYDWFGELRLDVADFLVGGASGATTLTLQAEGEIGVV